jgi:membrane protease YdiL (CAAX protease family)
MMGAAPIAPVKAAARSGRSADAAVVALALAGLAVAVFLRVRLAGPAGAASVPAGFTFGVALAGLALAAGVRIPKPTADQIAAGLAAAAVLCAPVVAHRIAAGPGVVIPPGAFPLWAAGVTLVAVAEELLLRGALYARLATLAGPLAAVTVTAAAFALLHAPIYGWRVVPLDLAVGVTLGVLRWVSGTVTVPAIAHAAADLAGWWLR